MSKNLSIYIARPLAGCKVTEVQEWYSGWGKLLRESGYIVYEPISTEIQLMKEGETLTKTIPEHRNKTYSTKHAIFERDKWFAEKASVTLAYFGDIQQISIGAIMELAWARAAGHHTVVVVDPSNVSYQHDFINEAAAVILPDMISAMDYLRTLNQ